MDGSGLDAIEATEAWRSELRQHGIAFVQADDLAKQYRSQLKPVSATIRETRENVIGLLTARNVPKCEISELGASLKVVRRPAKKAPTRSMVKDRCVGYFEQRGADDPEGEGEQLFAHLYRPEVSEAVFLRRGKIGGRGRAASATGMDHDGSDLPDDDTDAGGDDE
ncbi:MAG: hypothetical protein EOP01_00320 [Propionibacteriaceae bacterium]|nr:MAG: hypothetical protein EOP01_00320 [Propionibacteriaceae bacterium]